ncbi:nucleolar complex protein 4 homolog B [Drosophila grimshawi]|uniref:nucleolar complex protein 4 homolog B n=1 Tax=Drosophila grimshawi TaxID=7222 RepID=UPI001C936F50|nr:nucleolar complex protein 4 homolog B [Drosophila grimshawi]
MFHFDSSPILFTMRHSLLVKRLARPQEPEAEMAPAKRTSSPPELQKQVNAFLNVDVDVKVLQHIINLFTKLNVSAIGEMYVTEVIFKNLLKRKCIYGSDTDQIKPNPKPNAKTKAKLKQMAKENKPNGLFLKYYNDEWSKLLIHLASSAKDVSAVALNVCMQFILAESKYAKLNAQPHERLRIMLQSIITSETTPPAALVAFEKYARCLDILQLAYQVLPELAPVSFVDSPNEALNYLAIINSLDLSKTVLSANKYHLTETNPNRNFEYEETRKHLNSVWNGIIARCSDLDEKVHRQVLVVLLERIFPHLDEPILLTDFLMNSLHQFDGPVALLALQGIFKLMQEQNITYPDVYQKLYNMFYPRMFYNKYKARLFYLADIFLTSTHLPENLVAAFVKRLARLALKSPTEDAIILIRFVCNLLLRHTGLQRLICATDAASAVEISDPYDERELDPVKTGALNSSLWEMLLLQKHAVPEVANAARFISKSLPVFEFDLGPLLEIKECDIFDDEVKKMMKQFALSYDRPANFGLPQNDIVTKYWDII